MPVSRTVHTSSETETLAFGHALARELAPGTLVALTGDLGAGKTALVRGICDALGCGEQVTSPTFTIVNEYEGSHRVLHCDLYRLETMEEMLEIGLDEVFRSDAVILVEWAERAVALLPLPRIEIRAAHGANEHERTFTVHTCDDETRTLLHPLHP